MRTLVHLDPHPQMLHAHPKVATVAVATIITEATGTEVTIRPTFAYQNESIYLC